MTHICSHTSLCDTLSMTCMCCTVDCCHGARWPGPSKGTHVHRQQYIGIFRTPFSTRARNVSLQSDIRCMGVVLFVVSLQFCVHLKTVTR